jgi:GDPmannose 4,6-dehydratase
MMLQADAPDDYVLSSGETHSIRELVELAFGYLDMDYKKYVIQDPKFYRPAEVHLLLGNPAKAKKKLGWEPEVNFEQLIKMMVDSDLKLIKKEHGIE